MLSPEEKKDILKAFSDTYGKIESIKEGFLKLKDDIHNLGQHVRWIEQNFDFPNIEGRKETHVSIADGAFLTILTSCVEAYPSIYMGRPSNIANEGEALGHLYGSITEGKGHIHYHVKSVSVMHNYSEQTNTSCRESSVHYEKIRYVTEKLKGVRLLGCFHSHPHPLEEFTHDCSEFSDNDQEVVRETLNEYDIPPLELIFSLSYLHNAKFKSPKVKSSSITNFCNRYKYILRTFVYSFNTDSLHDVNRLNCKLAEKPINY